MTFPHNNEPHWSVFPQNPRFRKVMIPYANATKRNTGAKADLYQISDPHREVDEVPDMIFEDNPRQNNYR